MAESTPSYRDTCVENDRKAQEDYDKAILTLSGGALGVSFAFVKDYLGVGPTTAPWMLFVSWLAWAAAIILIVCSFWLSQRAWRAAIHAVDEGNDTSPKVVQLSNATVAVNLAAGIAFVLGVLFMAAFVYCNLDRQHGEEEIVGPKGVWIWNGPQGSEEIDGQEIQRTKGHTPRISAATATAAKGSPLTTHRAVRPDRTIRASSDSSCRQRTVSDSGVLAAPRSSPDTP